MQKIILLTTLILFCFFSKAQISSSNFGTRTDFSIGANGAINIATGDMDGDGKKDVVVANQTTGVISIFRNTSTASSISFATRIDSTAAGQLATILLTDFDGDGKSDVVLSANTGTTNFVVVYKNISTTGNILIGAKQIFPLGTFGGNASGLWTGDLDGDGKPDIANSNYSNTSYSILRNTSTSGTINFAAASTTSVSVAQPSQLILADMDNDGKPDMINFINGTNVLVYKNTTTSGSIIFSSSPVTLTAGSGAHRGDVADVDGDGKLDIACSNYSNSNSSLFRNTSTTGTISFATQVLFQAPTNYIQSTLLKDLDLDGKPELIQSTGGTGNSKISVSRNFAISGSISTSSFGTRLDFTSASAPTGLNVTDLDGDGKPEILSANFSAASFSVFKNDVVPSNGLIGYYSFSGNSGDSSGFGNHGTIYSGVTLTTDRFATTNNAYHFDGTANAYINVPSSQSLNTANMNNVCVSAWFRITSGTTVNTSRSIFQFQDASNINYAVSYNATTGKIDYFNWNVSVGNISFSTVNTLSTAMWYHIILRVDSANNTQIFVNNTLWGSSTTTVVKPISPIFSIGRHPVVTNTWNYYGDIDDIRIFNRYVSNSEIGQLYNQQPFTNTYYSKSSGSLDSLSTWGTNMDGTGAAPPNFSQNNTGYNVKNNSSPTISSNWIITGTNTAVIFGDGTNAMNTSIPAGITFGADSFYVRNNVTFTVLGTLITNKPGFETGSTVQYTSTGTQNILPASFYNLVVSGGTKSIIANTTVRNTLAMIANINCGSNTLTLGTSASQTGTLTYGSGIITGNFARWFAATTNSGSASGLFPIGTSTIYRPLQIEYTSAPTTGGILSANFIGTNPGSSGLNPAINDFSISPIVAVNKAAPNGYWTLVASNGLAGGTYSNTITATGFYGITSYTGLRMLRRNNSSSAWSLTGSAVTPTGSNATPVVQRTGITTIGGDFGIGADSTVNPLPVSLLNFTANKIDDKNILLNWQTSFEINNDHFEIERSIDNSSWIIAGKMKGNGTRNLKNDYRFIENISSIQHQVSSIYYRLKQVDIDGKFEYSKTVEVKINSIAEKNISIYPNPNNGNFVIENSLEQNSRITFSIINLLGEKLWSNSLQLQSGKNITTINTNFLSPGIYFLQIETDSNELLEVKKVLVK